MCGPLQYTPRLEVSGWPGGGFDGTLDGNAGKLTATMADDSGRKAVLFEPSADGRGRPHTAFFRFQDRSLKPLAHPSTTHSQIRIGVLSSGGITDFVPVVTDFASARLGNRRSPPASVSCCVVRGLGAATSPDVNRGTMALVLGRVRQQGARTPWGIAQSMTFWTAEMAGPRGRTPSSWRMGISGSPNASNASCDSQTSNISSWASSPNATS